MKARATSLQKGASKECSWDGRINSLDGIGKGLVDDSSDETEI